MHIVVTEHHVHRISNKYLCEHTQYCMVITVSLIIIMVKRVQIQSISAVIHSNTQNHNQINSLISRPQQLQFLWGSIFGIILWCCIAVLLNIPVKS